MNFPTTRKKSRGKGGFTLIEILLALTLMVLVVSLAYSGMVLFKNVTVAGRDQTLQVQLARTIERKMRADIRGVLFYQPKPVTGTLLGQGSGSATRSQNSGSTSGSRGNSGSSGTGGVRGSGGATSQTGSASSSNMLNSSGSSTASNGANQSTSTASGSLSARSQANGAMAGANAAAQTAQAMQMTTLLASLTPLQAYSSQSVGLFGNATTLVLHIKKPRRETARALGTMAGVTLAAPATGMCDLRSICYFLASGGAGGMMGGLGSAGAGMTGGLGSTAGGAAGGMMGGLGGMAGGASPMLALGPDARGLVRINGDRLRTGMASANGTVAPLARQVKVIAPEVVFLQFRYFNGTIWVATWNSAVAKALPRAIEVTLRIDASLSARNTAAREQQQNQTSPQETSPAPVTAQAAQGLAYRFVVALPTSNPAMGMATSGTLGASGTLGTGGLP